MKIKIYLYAVVLPAVFPLITAAVAQNPPFPAPIADAQNHELRREPPRVNPVLATLDTDKNGTLSLAEIAASGTTLRTLDKNHDGTITPDELRPAPTPAGIPTAEIVGRMLEFDRNHDGKLTVAELPSRLKPLLSKADTSKDSVLSVAELTAHVDKQEAIRAKAEQEAAAKNPSDSTPESRRAGFGGEQPRRGNGDGMRRGGPGGGGPGGPGGMRMNPLLLTLDTDKDGTLSAAEITAAPAALKSLDKNNDGVVTADELQPFGFNRENNQRGGREGKRP